MKIVLLLFALGLCSCMESSEQRRISEIKPAQDACLNSCVRGIDKFKYSYGGFDCECRP